MYRLLLVKPTITISGLGGATVAMPWAIGPIPRRRGPLGPALQATADASCGTANLLTRPRAGNISSDTRAGLAGRTTS
jgi:hypothetical protein